MVFICLGYHSSYIITYFLSSFYKMCSVIGRNMVAVDFLINSRVRDEVNIHEIIDSSRNGIFINDIKIRGKLLEIFWEASFIFLNDFGGHSCILYIWLNILTIFHP